VTASRATTALRTSAIVALGAFAVHQLRYAVTDGTGAAETHAYLATLFPLLLGLVASGVIGSFALAARTGNSRGERLSWAHCTVALLAIFVVQESAEGSALLAREGWVVVPIAVAVGRVVCWLLALVDAVERKLVVAERPSVPRAPASIGGPRGVARLGLAHDSLAFGLARRPPPPVAV
jgi:hypothetical protein